MSARAPRDGIARHYYTLRYPGAPRGGAVVGSVARLWAGMVVVCYAICQLLMAPGARGICSLIRCHFGRRRRLGQRADWAGVLASFAGATFWVVRHVLGLLWDYMY
jgi:hypothetical protein